VVVAFGLIVLLLAGVALAAWFFADLDPVGEIRRRHSPVVSMAREPARELGARVERWHLVTAAGDTLEGLWRGAPPGSVAPWTIVMFGGIGTDDRAALLVPPEIAAHVLAMRWPWRGPKRMSTPRFLRELPAVREAVLRSPAVLAAGAQAAAREPEGKAGRVALLGASLGAAPALAALSASPTPAALILLDGGAPISRLIRHELDRLREPRWLAVPAAAIAARLLAPLEPRHHAAAARARPILIFSARRDERLPPGSAEALHALLPHARVVWRDARHVRPRQSETIAAIARRAVAWLAEQR